MAETPVSDCADSCGRCPAASAELKYVDFVRVWSCNALSRAEGLANTAASYAPSFVVKYAKSAIETTRPTVEPYAKKAIDIVAPYADKALITVDGKVDSAVSYANSVYTRNRTYANMQLDRMKSVLHDGSSRFETYAGEYFKMIDTHLKALKGKLHDASSKSASELVSDLSKDMQQVVSKASQMPKEQVLKGFAKLQEAWESLMAHPEVAKVMEYSSSRLQKLQARAESAHDYIVADPRYSGLLDRTAMWLDWARRTTVGSTIMSYTAPYVYKIAETEYAKSATPYANRVVDYWKPVNNIEGVQVK